MKYSKERYRSIADISIVDPEKREIVDIDDSVDVSFVPMANVTEQGELDLSEVKKLGEVRKSYTYFKEGDVLLAKITPCMENGKGCLAKNLVNEIGFGSSEFYVLRPKDGIDGLWLYYVTKSEKFRIKAGNNMTGSSGHRRVQKYFFEKYKVYVPNIEEQKKIAQVLKKSEEIIKQRKEQIETLDKFRESIFNYMFGRGKVFENVKLGEFTNHVSSGSTPKGGQKVYTTQGIPFIRSQNVIMNKIVYDDISYIPIEIHESMNRSKVLKNDVLLNITGASIGRVAVYKGEDNMANVNQHVCIIRLKNDLKPVYVCNYIATNEFQNKIKNMNSGATREALNYDQIKNFIIPKPPIELQNEFAEIVNKIEKEKELLKQSLEQLETNFKALEQKAFNGELFN